MNQVAGEQRMDRQEIETAVARAACFYYPFHAVAAAVFALVKMSGMSQFKEDVDNP